MEVPVTGDGMTGLYNKESEPAGAMIQPKKNKRLKKTAAATANQQPVLPPSNHTSQNQSIGKQPGSKQ